MPTKSVNRRIRIGGQLVEYDDATQEVLLERSIVDVLKAKPGDHQNCMNSQCIKAQRNRRVFPHQVWAVSTVKSRVYIVDQIRLNGDKVIFQHAVRYRLPEKESRLITAHDSTASGEPGNLKLGIPRDPKGSPHRRKNAEKSGGSRFANGAGHGNSPGKKSTGQRNIPLDPPVNPISEKSTPAKNAATKNKGTTKRKNTARGAGARYKVAVGALIQT